MITVPFATADGTCIGDWAFGQASVPLLNRIASVTFHELRWHVGAGRYLVPRLTGTAWALSRFAKSLLTPYAPAVLFLYFPGRIGRFRGSLSPETPALPSCLRDADMIALRNVLLFGRFRWLGAPHDYDPDDPEAL